MNPLDEFFAEKPDTKTAGPNLGRFGRAVGSAAAAGLGTAAAGAGVAALGIGAGKLMDAVTKARDFRNMMGSHFNVDLHDFHAMRPKEFNEAFSSLRTFNPAFTKDPMVAGTYMRRMMAFKPDTAGGVLLEALSQREHLPESGMGEAFQRGAVGGAQAGMTAAMKPKEGPHGPTREEQVMLEAQKEYFRRIPREGEGAQPPEYFRDIAVGKESL